MNSYEEKQQRRKERLERAADRARAKAQASFKKADMSEEATGIPFGQPILVGHHSEGRHRNVIKRAHNAMRAGVEQSKYADELEHKAEGVGSGGISSDDPDAIKKLEEKLAGLIAGNEAAKRWNKQFRKGGVDAIDDEKARATAKSTMERFKWMRQPFGSNSANIRSVKERIEQLKKAASREHKEINISNFVRCVQNVEANRVQFLFADKPDEETRKLMKSYGFRWAPSEGAWQRQLTGNGIYSANALIQKFKEKETA